MIPYFATAGVEIFHGDCRDVLRALPAASVQTCVTSPPYFGLRDYGTGTWDGGDPECDHALRPQVAGCKTSTSAGQLRDKPSLICKCGARRIDQQIGLEPTPAEYVATMVEVFSEVRRVLRDDGTLWLNLGDSYCTSPRGNAPGDFSTSSLTNPARQDVVPRGKGKNVPQTKNPNVSYPDEAPHRFRRFEGIKPKDLLGIPWRVAFALQAHGWYLRSDIIWAKPNPMPESVTDRPTKAHEYLFLLAKSERYVYDAEAIAEPSSETTGGWQSRAAKGYRAKGNGETGQGYGLGGVGICGEERNKRTVWTVSTRPYPGAHFATFPPDLIEPCILAGSKPGDAVLDPFNGSGTTGEVCQKWGRRYIGIELNAGYIDLSAERFRQHVLFSPEVA